MGLTVVIGFMFYGAFMLGIYTERYLNKRERYVQVKPHVTDKWDDEWNPICVPDCPRCSELERPDPIISTDHEQDPPLYSGEPAKDAPIAGCISSGERYHHDDDGA